MIDTSPISDMFVKLSTPKKIAFCILCPPVMILISIRIIIVETIVEPSYKTFTWVRKAYRRWKQKKKIKTDEALNKPGWVHGFSIIRKK